MFTMFHFIRPLALAALTLAVLAIPAQAAPAAHEQRLAIPAYFYPGPLWTQLEQAAPGAGIAVVNPTSGPGSARNADYAGQVEQAHRAGLTVLGYVHTSYGGRAQSDLEAEVNDYYTWYSVDGIFFDEASTDCAKEPLYAQLHDYVKAKGGRGLVALNPGTQTSECYMAAADVAVTFEGPFSGYTAGYSAPAWTARYDAQRFWHLVYAASTDADMQQAVALSKQRNAGWIYVTPDTLPNPWDTLPAGSYWTGELHAAADAGQADAGGGDNGPHGRIVVNVKDAGAKGDGRSDDTAAFSAALAELGPNGGELLVPRGTYLITPSHIAVGSNISVAGDGATITAATTGFSLFDVSGSHIRVAGLTIDGAEKAVRGMTVGGGSTDVVIVNDTFENFTQPGDASSDLYYQVPAGIRIEGNGQHITIDHSSIRNVVARNTNGPSWPHKVARGLWIAPVSGQTTSKEVTVKNTSFDQVGPKDDGDCLVIQDSTDQANLLVENDTFSNCHKRAIKIQVPGATILGNHIENPFLNNNFFDTYPGPFPFDMYSAISAYASNVTIAGNHADGRGSFWNAVEVGASACAPLSNVAIAGNVLANGSGSNQVGASLIRTMAPVAGLKIAANALDYAQFGITVQPGTASPEIALNVFGPHVTTQQQTYGTAC